MACQEETRTLQFKLRREEFQITPSIVIEVTAAAKSLETTKHRYKLESLRKQQEVHNTLQYLLQINVVCCDKPILHGMQHDPSYHNVISVKHRYVGDNDAHDAAGISDEHLSFWLMANIPIDSD